MKKIVLLISIILYCNSLSAQKFDDYFYPKTLRYDYDHCGDSSNEAFYYIGMKEEPYWAGNPNSLIDNLYYGNHFFKLFDLQSDSLIYSRGYCSLFNEWQHESEAVSDVKRSYKESLVMPYPKKKARIELYSRDGKGVFQKKYSHVIDPNSYFVAKQQPKYPTFNVLYNGNPQKKVDIVLLSEGYTSGQESKFRDDCAKFSDELFKYSPFKEYKASFNISGVWTPSADEGVSIPGENKWCQTALGAKFYTFDSERYQMVDDFIRVRDIASSAHYDYIYILSNTPKYGGGGIYNFYGIGSTNHPTLTGKVHVHEFGHLLLGLGDEYVGGTNLNDFYPMGVEPWEENLTTLTNFDSKQWSKMVDKSLGIPSKVMDANKDKVGVYEGGGYVSKGVYRPWINCMMNTLMTTESFCPVCQSAMEKMIKFHTK